MDLVRIFPRRWKSYTELIDGLTDIYYLSASGTLLSAIQPPEAIVPLDAQGNFYFTSTSDPVTGRVANQVSKLLASPDDGV